MSQTVRHTLQVQIDQLTREILNSTEKAWEAQKNKQLKQHTFWLDEKRKLTEERTELQKKLHKTPNEEDSVKPKTRQEIKDKIASLNKMAQAANRNMHRALEEKQLSQANTYLRQRNQFNSEVKHLNNLLEPSDSIKKETKELKQLNRGELKEKIHDYNKRALEADKKMRMALREKKLEKANELLQQRNYLNSEAKKLTELLKAPSVLEEKNQVSPIVKKRSSSISDSVKNIKKENPISNRTADIQKKEPPIINSLINRGEKKVSSRDTSLTREELKEKIRHCNLQAQEADKQMRIALREKRLLQANELLQQRNKLNAKAKSLLKQFQVPKTTDQATHNLTPAKEKVLSREELKLKLTENNKKALEADKKMRFYLKKRQYEKANELLKKRNQFNAESKKINLLLNPVSSTVIEKKPVLVKEKDEKNFQEQDSNKVKEENNKTILAGIHPEIENLISKKNTPIATKIATKIIAYRLNFIKFFYKRRELQQQIETIKKASAVDINKTLAILNKELKEHLKHPPKAYVEDHAHNEIILYLLNKVDERGIAYFDFPEITASTIGAPLKQLKSQQDLNDFIQDYTEEEDDSGSGKRVLLKHFIRDIMQVKCPLTISDLVLQDAIMDTATMEYGFVNLFDKIIDKANQEIIRLQDESDDPLMPKVLRPLGTFDHVGHRDAIQLIPSMENGIDQFSGAILADTTIQDNVISSTARLQGIFSTDGAFKNLKIINNKIRTQGVHKICILGMLDGEVTGNTDLNGDEIEIKIQPLRLGGGIPITNFFILGFSAGCSYQYGHIEGISGTDIDRRSKKVVRGRGYDQRKYLIDFNMDRFIQYYQNHGKIRGRFEAIRDCVGKMLQEGDALRCNAAALEALEQGASLQEATEIARNKG